MRTPYAVAETRTYSVVLQPEPEGGFTVRVPALPEIVTGGGNEEEALAMAKEAIVLVLESRHERGEEIPVEAGEVLLRELTVSFTT